MSRILTLAQNHDAHGWLHARLSDRDATRSVHLQCAREHGCASALVERIHHGVAGSAEGDCGAFEWRARVALRSANGGVRAPLFRGRGSASPTATGDREGRQPRATAAEHTDLHAAEPLL